VNPLATQALLFARAAADKLLTGVETKLPTLDTEALDHLEALAPKLDIPAKIITLAQDENATIVSDLTPVETSLLELLRDRIDALPSLNPSATAAAGQTTEDPPMPTGGSGAAPAT
jgi:hypothetical protein